MPYCPLDPHAMLVGEGGGDLYLNTKIAQSSRIRGLLRRNSNDRAFRG
jgi:hypothetical protein